MATKVTKTKNSTRAKKGKDNLSFISRLKSIVLGDDFNDLDFEFDDYDMKEPSKSEKAAVTKKINALKKDSETLVLKPRSFDDLNLKVISQLRERKTIILNLILLSAVEAQRAIDFVAVGTYLTNGHQERMDKYIYRFTPGNENVISFHKSSTDNEEFDEENSNFLNRDERLDELENEFKELVKHYTQIAADFENYKKFVSRDQDDFKLQITCKVVTLILPVLDNFERARQQLDPKSKEAQDIHISYQGLYKQLAEILIKLGVSPMSVVGQEFDPNFHEAVLREPSEEFEEDFIIEELQRGYHLEGKVLRHALVKVSMGPLKAKATVSTDKDLEEEKNKSQVKKRGRNKK